MVDLEKEGLNELKRIFGDRYAALETRQEGEFYLLNFAVTDDFCKALHAKKTDAEQAKTAFDLIKPLIDFLELQNHCSISKGIYSIEGKSPCLLIHFDREAIENAAHILKTIDPLNLPFDLQNFSDAMKYHQDTLINCPFNQIAVLDYVTDTAWRRNTAAKTMQTFKKIASPRKFTAFINYTLNLQDNDALPLPPDGEGYAQLPFELVAKKFHDIRKLRENSPEISDFFLGNSPHITNTF